MRLDHLLSKENQTESKRFETPVRQELSVGSCSILRVPEKVSLQEHKGKSLTSGMDETLNGGVAQLGEHLPCTQGVRSSILLISTKGDRERKSQRGLTEWAHSSGG